MRKSNKLKDKWSGIGRNDGDYLKIAEVVNDKRVDLKYTTLKLKGK